MEVSEKFWCQILTNVENTWILKIRRKSWKIWGTNKYIFFDFYQTNENILKRVHPRSKKKMVLAENWWKTIDLKENFEFFDMIRRRKFQCFWSSKIRWVSSGPWARMYLSNFVKDRHVATTKVLVKNPPTVGKFQIYRHHLIKKF